MNVELLDGEVEIIELQELAVTDCEDGAAGAWDGGRDALAVGATEGGAAEAVFMAWFTDWRGRTGAISAGAASDRGGWQRPGGPPR